MKKKTQVRRISFLFFWFLIEINCVRFDSIGGGGGITWKDNKNGQRIEKGDWVKVNCVLMMKNVMKQGCRMSKFTMSMKNEARFFLLCLF